MKRRQSILAGGVVGLGMLVIGSGMLFVNNIVSAVNWWRSFLVAGGDTAGVPAYGEGIWRWLSWSTVDSSCVTTFIPFLGFLMAWLAVVRLCGNRKVEVGENYPFFPSYDGVNVSLGLVGTLWGIIIIGFYKIDTVGMEHLMMCLHTALFSTLTAVVWVYLVERPIVKPVMRWMLERVREVPAEAARGGSAEAVEHLRGRILALSQSVAEQGEAFDAFEKRLGEVGETMMGMVRAHEEAAEAIGRREEAAEAALREREAAAMESVKVREEAMLALQKQFGERAVAEIERLGEAQKAMVKGVAEQLVRVEEAHVVFAGEVKKQMEGAMASQMALRELIGRAQATADSQRALLERLEGQCEAMAKEQEELRKQLRGRDRDVAELEAERGRLVMEGEAQKKALEGAEARVERAEGTLKRIRAFAAGEAEA